VAFPQQENSWRHKTADRDLVSLVTMISDAPVPGEVVKAVFLIPDTPCSRPENSLHFG
jgi:hypothetical protein